ncbi:MAG: rhodanese-like domain-containing protein [Kiritimatiellae bacterium]|nr:rhodanese-like domain-containing protein [Kiritimatiellia bacterium]
MTATLFAGNLLDTSAGLLAAGIVGLFFGWFLEQAGFGSSRRLAGIFYLRDMSVVKVMFTAVVTAMVGLQYLTAWGLVAPTDLYVLDTYWGAQAVGGVLFGIGFVMGGWCPGTALAGLAARKWDALVFLVGALLGSMLFNETFGIVLPLYEGWRAGPISLSDSLGLPLPVLIAAVAVLAVAMFNLCAWLERRAGVPAEAPAARRRNVWMGVLLLAAAGGVLALPPAPAARDGQLPVSASGAEALSVLTSVAAADDHIDAPVLADMLMAGAAGLTVVDLRAAKEYDRFHLRGAINIPLERLATEARARLPRTGLVVLYSNGTTHAAQAAQALQAAGWDNVRVLTDGILGFWRECLTPPSLSVTADPATAAAHSAAFAARRAFFLGEAGAAAPRTEMPAAPAAVTALEPAGPDAHLVDAAWLRAHLDDRGLTVLDVRAKSTEYTSSHVPGAIYLNIENIRATLAGIPNTVLPGEALAREFGWLGLAADDTVVVYSDELRDATLAAVALERVGHRRYAVLHGGWAGWLAAKGATDNRLPKVAASTYAPRRTSDDFTATLDDVVKASKDGQTVILDVRPPAYYRGEKSDEARVGHIPGAVNREFMLDLVPKSASWRDAETLRAAYRELGIAPETPVIVHCRTGHQASQSYFLLKYVLGVKSVRWFDGSWLAWSADASLPVAVAAE